EDVAFGDLVHARLDVPRERPPQLSSPVLVRLLEQPSEVLERELRIDGHQAVADVNDGVHAVAGGEGVLEVVVLAREHLSEQAFEEALAEAATHLRRPQNLLEARDVTTDVEDPLRDLAELAEAPLHRAHNVADVLELL